MPLPVTVPNTFANATSSIPLSQLDGNFSTLSNAINGINSGSETLANLKASNVTITGGTLTGITAANIAGANISSGNVTVTNVVVTTANVTTLNVTGNATIGDAAADTVTLNSTLTANTAVIFSAGTSAAPAITTTGDTNTGIFFPAADTIAFTEGGAEAMRIDSSGNVGIGTSSPSSYDAAARNLVVGNLSGNTGITISSGSSSGGFLIFADGTSGSDLYDGYLTYNHSVRAMTFYTAATDRMSINSSGNVQFNNNISVGGATPTTSGTGITFPATQSASTNANTLDDYEEGTWNSVISDNTNNATMGVAGCWYTKIGNTVTVGGNISTTSLGSVTGGIYIKGLPFTVASGSSNYVSLAVGYGAGLAITQGYSVTGYPTANQTYIELSVWDVTTGTTQMQASEWTADGEIVFSTTYKAA